MSVHGASWVRGARAVAVAGALALGVGGVAAQGGVAGALSEHAHSPANDVLLGIHGTGSHRHEAHGKKAHGKKAHGHRAHGHRAHGKKAHGQRSGNRGHKSRRDELPKVRHGTELSVEPVVRAGKGKPPKKLLIKNLVVGTGAKATRTSTVKVKYVGTDYSTGKNFTAATWKQGQAVNFSLHGQVIRGFAKGITGMRVGGRREIVIPPRLGYGKRAQGPIKANETLVFVVDLEGVS